MVGKAWFGYVEGTRAHSRLIVTDVLHFSYEVRLLSEPRGGRGFSVPRNVRRLAF